MPLAVSGLLAHRELGLVELHRGATSGRPVSWVSSSDLADPTPFLVPDQLLLTTGRQFADDAGEEQFGSYVENLRSHGVLGIGFGTEVLRSGTPSGLVDACRRLDVALVEVPYRTPFLAIIRLVARELERTARERETWALAATRAISAAALSRSDVSAVQRELAGRLGARVRRFDLDARLVEVFPRTRAEPTTEELGEVERLLAAGDRAASELDRGGTVSSFQTIGPAGALAGVLLVTGTRLDRAARGVLAAAVALVEVAESASRRTASGVLAVNAAVHRLLVEGRPELAAAVSTAAGISLPPMPGGLLVAAHPSPTALRALADREARGSERLVVLEAARLIVVTSRQYLDVAAQRLADRGAAVGTACVASLEELEVATARAAAAASRAGRGAVVSWASLEAPDGSADATRLAVEVIAPLAITEVGRLEIAAASAWFDANCNWGAAGRRLGLHPHTVRDRVRSLGDRLGLGLDAFEGRARLWGALNAAALAPAAVSATRG